MKTGIEIIADERKRQIKEEGWTPEHDDQHTGGELAQAAAAYAFPQDFIDGCLDIDTQFRLTNLFPAWWVDSWWKPSPDNRIRELEKSGALIAAEIDRLQRA